MKMVSIASLIVSISMIGACSGSERSTPATPTPVASSSPLQSSSPSSSTIAVGHGSTLPSSSPAQSSSSRGSSSTMAGGVSWTAPARWTQGPERPMRAATYHIPASKDDKEGAECAVFFFGPGQGGSVQANIDRWIGQFEQADGKSSSERAKQARESINGIRVTTIDLTGTFLGGGPMMGAGGAKKPGYRLLGAIVEGPDGAVFFKLTGPANTVRSAESEFRTLLDSLKK